MKKILFSLLIILSMTQLGKSQVIFGGGLSYDVLDDFGVKTFVQFDVVEDWRGQIAYTYYFGDWALDFDGQFELIEFDVNGNEGFIKPIGGLNIDRDGSADDTDLGINLGINLDFVIGERRFFLEPKLTIGGTGGIVISAGVMF